MQYLPPAFRRNGKGTVFTGVCLAGAAPFLPDGVGGGGTPILLGWEGVPSSFPTGRVPPIPVQDGDTPIQVQDRGGTPSQVRMGEYPRLLRSRSGPWLGQEVPPSQVRMGGTPIQGQDGGSPIQGQDEGVPWGTPLSHPGQVPDQDGGTPNWNSTACTCYGAGGMQLAFTQDFLVINVLGELLALRIYMPCYR